MSKIEISSGNVYADLGDSQADEMLVKARLAFKIGEIIKQRHLTQVEAADLLGLTQPKLSGLHFVQIDEFYPIDANQHNSFFYYVNKYYINGFNLDKNKALLIKNSRTSFLS